MIAKRAGSNGPLSLSGEKTAKKGAGTNCGYPWFMLQLRLTSLLKIHSSTKKDGTQLAQSQTNTPFLHCKNILNCNTSISQAHRPRKGNCQWWKEEERNSCIRKTKQGSTVEKVYMLGLDKKNYQLDTKHYPHKNQNNKSKTKNGKLILGQFIPALLL